MVGVGITQQQRPAARQSMQHASVKLDTGDTPLPRMFTEAVIATACCQCASRLSVICFVQSTSVGYCRARRKNSESCKPIADNKLRCLVLSGEFSGSLFAT